MDSSLVFTLDGYLLLRWSQQNSSSVVRFELFLFKAAYFAEATKLAEQLKVKFSLLL